MSGDVAIRTKGGVIRIDGKYYAMVDIWGNAECEGDPKRIVWKKAFASEAEALRYYISAIRPHVMAINQQLAEDIGGSLEHYNIWERGHDARGDKP
jgi:hypothetical protein